MIEERTNNYEYIHTFVSRYCNLSYRHQYIETNILIRELAVIKSMMLERPEETTWVHQFKNTGMSMPIWSVYVYAYVYTYVYVYIYLYIYAFIYVNV